MRLAAGREEGQVVPLVAVIAIVFLASGVLVFWLGVGTSMSTSAQTSADAAALAAEKTLQTALFTPGPDGHLPTLAEAAAEACISAEGYAQNNGGHVITCQPASSGSSFSGYDMEVEVADNQAMPSGTPAAGEVALAHARASSDPYSQASPAILQTTSPADCEASVGSGPTFTPHGGPYGFFPASGSDYTRGCEPQVAGELDALALALQLRVTGASGYVSVNEPTAADPVATAHQCGAASATAGLGSVPDSTLAQYNLTRPFAGRPNEIEMVNGGCGTATTSTDSSSSAAVGFGNTNVHLVPWTGGADGAGLLFGAGGITTIDLNQMQIGCLLYSAAQAVHADHNVVLALLAAGWDESTMRDLGPDGQLDSLGVLQQRASMGWGTPTQEMNPYDAAMMFLIGDESGSPYYTGLGGSPGAIYYDSQNPGIPPWVLAQDVQGSIDSSGSNYEAQLGAAQTMLGKIQGGACANGK